MGQTRRRHDRYDDHDRDAGRSQASRRGLLGRPLPAPIEPLTLRAAAGRAGVEMTTLAGLSRQLGWGIPPMVDVTGGEGWADPDHIEQVEKWIASIATAHQRAAAVRKESAVQ